MKYLQSKTKYLPTLVCLIVEMGVSGYYSQVDYFWVFTRIGLALVYIAFVIADSIKPIQWLPAVLIALSLMSVRDKWQSIEQEKLSVKRSNYKTLVAKPEKPKLPNCDNLVNWKKDNCDARSEKLQLAYDEALRQYNSRVINSESKIENATVTLSWYDQQPVWIYIILVCVMSLLTFVSTPEEKKIESKIDLKTEIKNRLDIKMSDVAIQKDLGIGRRKFERLKKEIVNQYPSSVQSVSNIVKFNGRKNA